jgi:hypothetical protein
MTPTKSRPLANVLIYKELKMRGRDHRALAARPPQCIATPGRSRERSRDVSSRATVPPSAGSLAGRQSCSLRLRALMRPCAGRPVTQQRRITPSRASWLRPCATSPTNATGRRLPIPKLLADHPVDADRRSSHPQASSSTTRSSAARSKGSPSTGASRCVSKSCRTVATC